MIYATELRDALVAALEKSSGTKVPLDREIVLDMIDVVEHVMRDLGEDFSTEEGDRDS